jgi:hypothetical protein
MKQKIHCEKESTSLQIHRSFSLSHTILIRSVFSPIRRNQFSITANFSFSHPKNNRTTKHKQCRFGGNGETEKQMNKFQHSLDASFSPSPTPNKQQNGRKIHLFRL